MATFEQEAIMDYLVSKNNYVCKNIGRPHIIITDSRSMLNSIMKITGAGHIENDSPEYANLYGSPGDFRSTHRLVITPNEKLIWFCDQLLYAISRGSDKHKREGYVTTILNEAERWDENHQHRPT
jgi:hypothetical protein